MDLTVKDVAFKGIINMRKNSDPDSGSMHVLFKQVDLSLGGTQFSFQNTQMASKDLVAELLVNEALKIGKVLLQNSFNMIEWPIVASVMDPMVESMLNNYMMEQRINVGMIEKDASFLFDYKLTNDPQIKPETWLDMFFFGELTYKGTQCNLGDNTQHAFVDRTDVNQVIISERMINCALLAFENSPFGELVLSSEFFDKIPLLDSVVINADILN